MGVEWRDSCFSPGCTVKDSVGETTIQIDEEFCSWDVPEDVVSTTDIRVLDAFKETCLSSGSSQESILTDGAASEDGCRCWIVVETEV